jgi:hypothetical protein
MTTQKNKILGAAILIALMIVLLSIFIFVNFHLYGSTTGISTGYHNHIPTPIPTPIPHSTLNNNCSVGDFGYGNTAKVTPSTSCKATITFSNSTVHHSQGNFCNSSSFDPVITSSFTRSKTLHNTNTSNILAHNSFATYGSTYKNSDAGDFGHGNTIKITKVTPSAPCKVITTLPNTTIYHSPNGTSNNNIYGSFGRGGLSSKIMPSAPYTPNNINSHNHYPSTTNFSAHSITQNHSGGRFGKK